MKPTPRRRSLRSGPFVPGSLCLAAWLASAAVPPVQYFYLPFPEAQLLTALQAIESGGPGSAPASPMRTYVSIAAIANGTVVYYDHWEDGYEPDLASPVQASTQIWGDNNPANGMPPGLAADVIDGGTVIVLDNPVPIPRVASAILYDGRDKLAATKTISLTKTSWASGSNSLLAGSVEVFDTDNWGFIYQVPVGTNIPDNSDRQMFEYTGLVILAREDATTVTIDADASGAVETTLTLNQGQSHLVNGGVRVGAQVFANKAVQVDLITGDIGSNYESRDSALLPIGLWTSSYYTPVSTSPATVVWLYNPGRSAITVSYQYRSGTGLNTINTGTVKVPGSTLAGGYARVELNDGTGYHFYTAADPFYAFSTTDAGSTDSDENQAWDWGYTLIPDDSLSSQLQIALGIGRDPTSSTNPTENGNPVWVMPTGIGNTTASVKVYVDYNGDGLGPNTDPNGNKYDTSLTLRELERAKVYDPDGSQTGMIIYVLPGQEGTPLTVKLAAAWGQDPSKASAGAPGLDVGTGVPPVPLFEAGKDATLIADADGDGFISPGDTIEYEIRISNVSRAPVPDLLVKDTLPGGVTYVPHSTGFRAGLIGLFSVVVDDPVGTPFPLDEAGYAIGPTLRVGQEFQVTYRATVKDYANLGGATHIVNAGTVASGNTTQRFRDEQPLYGSLGDRVWHDLNGDGKQDGGEPGLSGVTVFLDLNHDGIQDPGEPTTTTGADGFYTFKGLVADTYDVRVIPATLPAGVLPTYDLDGVATAHQAEVPLGGGQNREDADFGYRQSTPTAAGLAYFRATSVGAEGVLLEWGTLVEVSTLGFRLERAVSGGWERVGPGLVAATGQTRLPQSYSATDPQGGVTYRLVEIELTGRELVLAEATVRTRAEIEVGIKTDNGSLHLSLKGQPHALIRVETAPAVAGPWMEFRTSRLDGAGSGVAELGVDSAQTARFFRVVTDQGGR